MNEIENLLTAMFQDWGSEINYSEKKALAEKAAKHSSDSWRNEHLAYVTTSGAAAGITGGWWSVAAIAADLAWCRKVAPQACLGLGHICDREVDYSQDMNHIMAIWTGTATTSNFLPQGIIDDNNSSQGVNSSAVFTGGALTGKIGAKASPKMFLKFGLKGTSKIVGKAAGDVTGKIISKTVLKSGSKIVAKITSKVVDKAVAKVAAKFVAKLGVGWIPLIGGVVSGGINFWLLSGLMDAAYSYYTHDYIIYKQEELEIEYAY
jgi:hypothetical protein